MIQIAGSQMERAVSFAAQLDKWASKIPDRLDEAYRHIAMLLFANIVIGGSYSPGTPVDTGFARNSWIVGLNGVPAFTQPAQLVSADRGQTAVGLESFDTGNDVLTQATVDDVIYLVSNCIYILPLEDGHSQQAPTGMVWLALSAAQDITAQVVREMKA